MKTVSVLFALFFSLNVFSQDPGHCLFVKITDNGKAIKGKDLDEYKVLLSREFLKFDGDHYLGYDTDNCSFYYFDWNLFDREIYEVKIISKKETMIVHFRMDPASVYKKDEHPYTEQLYLNIPFKKGYYEVTDFVQQTPPKNAEGSGTQLVIKDDHQWIDLPVGEMKLIMDKVKR